MLYRTVACSLLAFSNPLAVVFPRVISAAAALLSSASFSMVLSLSFLASSVLTSPIEATKSFCSLIREFWLVSAS
jgi:hypothetical protein